MALWFYDYNRYHDLMVFTQISNFQIFIFNHPKLGNNKIPLIFDNMVNFNKLWLCDVDTACHVAMSLASSYNTS